MCKRNSPDLKKKKKKCQHQMCKRNTPDKNEPSMGCVRKITRENPQIKKTEEVYPTWYV